MQTTTTRLTAESGGKPSSRRRWPSSRRTATRQLNREDRSRVGISQPYVFRLFGTKLDLFKAAVGRCLTKTLDVFEHSAAGKQDSEALNSIAVSYIELLRARPQAPSP